MHLRTTRPHANDQYVHHRKSEPENFIGKQKDRANAQ